MLILKLNSQERDGCLIFINFLLLALCLFFSVLGAGLCSVIAAFLGHVHLFCKVIYGDIETNFIDH